MTKSTRTAKVKRLEPNQLTDYFWKDCDLAYSDNQLCLNDAGESKVMADTDYVDNKINTIINSAINTALNNATTNILNSAHPVGSIYISVSGTDPSVLFGGKWVYWGAGRTLVSYNSGDANFGGVEWTGGAKSVALTQANMPSLTTISTTGGNYSSYLRSDALTVGTAGSSYGWNIHNGSQISPATTTVGSSTGVNVLNPYITCYMWKRVE